VTHGGTAAGRRQALVFGEVADEYDDVRAGYPAELADAVFGYAGSVPDAMVEIGAGTGKATDLFARRVPSVTCVEPDPLMAAVLRRRLGTRVDVRVGRFEDWVPPSGGVPLLACAQAWHWMDPDRRLDLAHRALAPRGVLALFGHVYMFADERLRDATDKVYRRIAPELADVDAAALPPLTPEPHASPLFTDPYTAAFHRTVAYPTGRYLALLRTFSNHRMLPEERRSALHGGLAGVVDGYGGVVEVRLETELILARRAD
jgi:SAM-dependent methyltransferase